MLNSIQKFVVYCWGFVFNHEVNSLRHIPDVTIRHYGFAGPRSDVGHSLCGGGWKLYVLSR